MVKVIYIFLVVLVSAAFDCPADTHYVSLAGTNNYPYTNWADAATDVTWSVSAAGDNDTVQVTNGTYFTSNRMYSAAAALTLQSVNGRDVTFINGASHTDSCAILTSSSSAIDGFTITNYNLPTAWGIVTQVRNAKNCRFVNNIGGLGGGIYSKHDSKSVGIITNCIFKNNYSRNVGGGIYAFQSNRGYTSTITIAGCYFEANTSVWSGGAFDLRVNQCFVSNCVIINNFAGQFGGGIMLAEDAVTNCIIANCTFTGNVCLGTSGRGLGGAICNIGSNTTIRNCSFIGNIVTNRGGAIYGHNNYGAKTIIQNCLIARNISLTNAGGGIWISTGIVESCTIVSNQAAVAGGGVYADCDAGQFRGTNNIIYFNTAGVSANNFTNTAGNTGLNYSCVIPAVDGTGNITNNPALLDLVGGNYRLRINSPCVNAGTNLNWMTNAVDLDGNLRIRYGIVDMGAYEAVLRQGNIYRVR